MAGTSRAKSQRAGRKDVTERIRELVALLGSLTKTGDRITIDAISSRMGIPRDEAVSLMDIVCAASGEESCGLLISMNDDEDEFTLQYPGVHGRPLRLTEAETVALIHALDLVGVEEQDPLRTRLRDAFSSSKVEEDYVRQSLGSALGDEWHALHQALLTCAQAQVDECGIDFLYQGMRDDTPRARMAEVLRIGASSMGWYVKARDLEIDQERTFRVDRMSKVRLGDPLPQETISQQGPDEAKYVVLRFADPCYLTMFDWPGLKVIRMQDGITIAQIPYYGQRSNWLPRRIVACGGTMVAEDDELMERALHYALELR